MGSRAGTHCARHAGSVLLTRLQGSADGQALWPGLRPADLRRLRRAAACLARPTATWFGEYGCALLALPATDPLEGGEQPAEPACKGCDGDGGQQAEEAAGMEDVQPEPRSLALLLVGLDDWRFVTHRCAAQAGVCAERSPTCSAVRAGLLPPATAALPAHPRPAPCTPQPSLRSLSNGDIRHAADCAGSSVVHCGQLPASELGAFQGALQAVMAQVAERKGDARSAAGGRQGHQKTPAMVRAAALQALAQLRAEEGAKVAEEVPQGGFTDVGLHTGGLPRGTAWPLVRDAFKVRSTAAHNALLLAACPAAVACGG